METRIAFLLPTLGLLLAAGPGCGIKKEIHQKCVTTLADRDTELAALKTKYGADVSGLESDKAGAKERIQALLGDMKNAEQELEACARQRQKAEVRIAAFRRLRERLRQLVDTGKLQVTFRDGQMILKLPSEILFPSGKARLSKEGEQGLNEVLQVLIEFKDRRFMVAGHTDNVPIKSRKFTNNWYLSTARAVRILEAMVATGFDARNLLAAGFGEFRPVASNDAADGRRLNRRIEIILLPDLSDLPNLTNDDS